MSDVPHPVHKLSKCTWLFSPLLLARCPLNETSAAERTFVGFTSRFSRNALVIIFTVSTEAFIVYGPIAVETTRSASLAAFHFLMQK